MSWTAEMVAVVKRHWGNKSAREIGDMIDRNRNAVIGKAHRLGLTINVISNGRRNRLDQSAGDKPCFQSPRYDQCQWLEDEPRDRDFCLAPSREGSSYCEAHHGRCVIGYWTPGKAA